MAEAAGDEGESEGSSPEKITTICDNGKLILEIREYDRSDSFVYRVDVDVLKTKSGYFNRLLDASKFSEGRQVAEKLRDLKLSKDDSNVVSISALPRISVLDVGKISKVKSIGSLCTDFLKALHGMKLGTMTLPLANLANLAIVADRFDALPAMSDYVHRHKLLQALDGSPNVKAVQTTAEEKMRQRILIGVLLDHPRWISTYTKRLIVSGSSTWSNELQRGEVERQALWWDLPRGLEDELLARREYALETLDSLPTYFLDLYSSSERQCKLGYGSSLQCDAYQLGEMMRFLKKSNLVRWEGRMLGTDSEGPFQGKLDTIIETLRRCPSYQVDSYHSHCGLRSRLIPILDWIEPYLVAHSYIEGADLGVCGQCWLGGKREEESWALAKRPVAWTFDSGQLSHSTSRRSRQSAGVHQHSPADAAVRRAFLAVDRHWTTQDVSRNGFSSTPTLGTRKL